MPARKILKRAAIAAGALLLLPVVLFTGGVLWPERELTPVRTDTPIAIVGVSIVDPREEIKARDPNSPIVERKPQTVLVSGGRIAGIGDDGSIALPPDAVVIDGGGRYLLPALWDMHTHIYAVSPLLGRLLKLLDGPGRYSADGETSSPSRGLSW